MELLNLLSETAAYKNIIHPDYSKLAARLSIVAINMLTKENLLEYAKKVYKFEDNGNKCQLLADDVYQIYMKHHKKLQNIIKYKRDFNYNYFGLKTLERAYLLRVKGVISERP